MQDEHVHPNLDTPSVEKWQNLTPMERTFVGTNIASILYTPRFTKEWAKMPWVFKELLNSINDVRLRQGDLPWMEDGLMEDDMDQMSSIIEVLHYMGFTEAVERAFNVVNMDERNFFYTDRTSRMIATRAFIDHS